MQRDRSSVRHALYNKNQIKSKLKDDLSKLKEISNGQYLMQY